MIILINGCVEWFFLYESLKNVVSASILPMCAGFFYIKNICAALMLVFQLQVEYSSGLKGVVHVPWIFLCLIKFPALFISLEWYRNYEFIYRNFIFQVDCSFCGTWVWKQKSCITQFLLLCTLSWFQVSLSSCFWFYT